MATTAVIYVGGDHSRQLAPPIDADLSIAADSGLHLAHQHERSVDVVIGDMDSVTDAALERAAAEGAEIRRHDADKDETDLELALGVAVARGVDRLVVVGGAHGRLDHELANVAALTHERLRDVTITAFMGRARIDVVHRRVEVAGLPGMTCSLLSWGGGADGVTTRGLRWPLEHARLDSGAAVGTSNEFIDAEAVVSVDRGTLTVTCPDVTDLYISPEDR
jgi:thiamine pyrophosphokinase